MEEYATALKELLEYPHHLINRDSPNGQISAETTYHDIVGVGEWKSHGALLNGRVRRRWEGGRGRVDGYGVERTE